MKIPKSIIVYGKKYKVKRVKDLKDDKGILISGLHEYDKGLISLDTKLKSVELDQTFFHELGHAVQERVGVNQGEISDDLKEVIVDSMATFLAETFHFRLK